MKLEPEKNTLSVGHKFFPVSWPAAPGNVVVFWKFISLLTMLALFLCWFIISGAANDERARMIHSMQRHAESLIWSIEGGARFFRDVRPGDLSQMILEIGGQPGVAWIALLDEGGRILVDSDPQLANSLLYTPAELAKLKPSTTLQGRFSPDDPDIYETWKRFQPERLIRRMRHHSTIVAAPREHIIFIALDASNFHASLREYIIRLWIFAGSVSLASLFFIALVFYIYNFRQSRQKLADTEALAMQVIDNFPSALLLTDCSGKLTLYNHKAKKIFNLPDSGHVATLKNLPTYHWQSLCHELDASSSIFEREVALNMNGKKNASFILSGVKVTDAQGRPTGYLFIIRKKEEIDQLKRKLAQSRHFSFIGQLAAGLAHEIRNPLSSIKGYAHYLSVKLVNDPMCHATADLLMEETERINGVLSDLLTLAKPPELKIRPRYLQPLLDKTYRLVLPDVEAKRIRLVLRDQEFKDAQANVDADKLLQALLNLVQNAIQITPAGGEIVLRLEKSGELADNEDGKAGWNISVADTGPGMSEEVMRQIFTPYFTTRVSGTGLGLSITRQIIESHGGEIHVVSSPGHGSVFTIFLPAISKENDHG